MRGDRRSASGMSPTDPLGNNDCIQPPPHPGHPRWRFWLRFSSIACPHRACAPFAPCGLGASAPPMRHACFFADPRERRAGRRWRPARLVEHNSPDCRNIMALTHPSLPSASRRRGSPPRAPPDPRGLQAGNRPAPRPEWRTGPAPPGRSTPAESTLRIRPGARTRHARRAGSNAQRHARTAGRREDETGG